MAYTIDIDILMPVIHFNSQLMSSFGSIKSKEHAVLVTNYLSTPVAVCNDITRWFRDLLYIYSHVCKSNVLTDLL